MNNDKENDSIKKFKKEREKLNDIVMRYGKINTKRFFNLDSNVYKKGALSSKTKELIGLVASLVLRCDDCILYHIIRCFEEGLSDEELEEALSIGLVVGGSITIPHVRRAYKHWEELKNKRSNQ
ncbi:MAG: carboxymuconolactone decarboxylase family protein [Candidatus Mcinerneyibacterium aminivorans]|uniref:Carboxymuconolactone decarboxylase family protein n=1 Tax=Candidatus Mcinerneyibacterium aminivorans TaxID=2703815 RepID=A0A5D0MDX6_9BACT|nr:MAG: carboxymuconolactone decarboxylase family protein [Candidatus Mcinerneyibacterium aminivorans]